MTHLRADWRVAAVALAVGATAAHAQQGDSRAAGGVQARLGFSQTWTDNLRLDDQNKDAALVTTITPGVSFLKNSGSVRGSLDYALNGIAYVKSSAVSRFQNALSANLQSELIPQTLSVDAQASIGQQNASAFGLQAAPSLASQGSASVLDNPNRRETGTVTVSPVLKGQVAGVAAFDLRGTASVTEVRGSALGDSRAHGGVLRVNPLSAGVLSWYAQASTQLVRPKESLTNHNRSAVAGLNYRPDPDWSFTVNAGKEWSDYLDRSNGAFG